MAQTQPDNDSPESEQNDSHESGGEIDTYNTIFGGGHSEFPTDF